MLTESHHIAADVVRIMVLIVALLAVASFPAAVFRQGRPASAWLAVAGTELILVGAAASVLDHFGRPLVWYRTPSLGIGSILLLMFCLTSFMGDRR